MPSSFLRRSIASLLSLAACFCSFTGLNAQVRFEETMLTDLGGKPIYIKVEYVPEGTPFFPEEYTRSIIKLKSGKTYTGFNAKMNFYDNTVIIRLDDGTEMEVTGKVSSIMFEHVPVGNAAKTVVFQRGFPTVDNLDSTAYYEVLDSGNIKLLKYSKVTYTDRKGFGEGNMTRAFTKKETYCLLLPGNSMRRIETGKGKGKEDLISLFPNNKSELEKYIEKKKLKCTKPEEWIDVVAYYNSLQ